MRSLHNELKAQYQSGQPSWPEIQSITKRMTMVHGQMHMIKAKIRYDFFKQTGMELPSKKRPKQMNQHSNQ